METENQITYPQELKNLDYFFGNDLKNLLLSIEDLAEHIRTESSIDIRNRGIDQISSLARIGANMINPFHFDSLEDLLEKLD